MLVGIVVKNDNDEYLFLKKQVGNQTDLALICGEIDENNPKESIKNMMISQVGYDFSDNVDVEPLLKGEDSDGEFVILFAKNCLFNKIKNCETKFLWCSFTKVKRLYKENKINL